MRERQIPEATVARLPLYLRSLVEMHERGMPTVSSEGLADAAGVNSAKVRKDLSYLGSYGTRGVGYDVEYLIYQISRELGLTQDWNCAIVGVGNLGHALANYRGFKARGFRVVALLDSDERKVGERVGELQIESFDDIERISKERQVSIGIIATPAPAAQEAAHRRVSAGVESNHNISPAVNTLPHDTSQRNGDLSIELQILSFYEQRKAALDSVRPAKRLTGSAAKSTRP